MKRRHFFRLGQSICDDAQSILGDKPAASNVNELLDALRSRFGLVASVEQYRSELNRLRRGTLTLHALSLEVRRLTSKAYPGPWSASTEIIARDAYLNALDNLALRNRILMTIPPPQTLAGTYELVVRAIDIDDVNELPSHASRHQPSYRVRGVDVETSRGDGTAAELQQVKKQLAELQTSIQQLTAATSAATPVAQPASRQPTASDTISERHQWRQRDQRPSVICYNCGKPGHIARECRRPKKKSQPPVSNEDGAGRANVISVASPNEPCRVYI
jgi:hypothetical protein